MSFAFSGRWTARWQLALAMLALAGFTVYVFATAFASAPAPESLVRSTVTLAGPVQLAAGSGKAHSSCALVAWEGGKASIEYLCFLSGCALPGTIAALKAGDRVTLSLAADTVWQVEHGGRIALHYDDVRAAHDAAARRRSILSIPLWAAVVALLAVVLARRRKLGKDGSRGG